jgi:cytochrome P450
LRALAKLSTFFKAHVPGYLQIARLPRQLLAISPFDGDVRPTRVPIFRTGRPSLPFPHPWNYREPIRILETYFWGADRESGSGKHNRYLEIPGLGPILVTSDPGIIRAITTETGELPGQFDRDPLPSAGIIRATGTDSLFSTNGVAWRKQRKLVAPPFGKTTLFQPELFHEFADTFRNTVVQRLDALQIYLASTGRKQARFQLDPEIKPVALELLINNFFGAQIAYEQLRKRYVPALERISDHLVRSTFESQLGLALWKLPIVSRRFAQLKADFAAMEELTDLVLAARSEGRGLWKQFKSDAPDQALRSNIKLFELAALEATSSLAGWALSHLARNPAAQEKLFQDVKDIHDYTPENLDRAKYLGHVLQETLRLTPSFYLLPRRPTADTWIETADGRRMFIPRGAHILLDVWHSNRHEEHWGVEATGHPALEFAPERWAELAVQGRASKDILHFGFGHGPRVCPGTHLGQLEVGLIVGAFVKLFKFNAVNLDAPPKAGISTKPLDGTLVDLELRPAG